MPSSTSIPTITVPPRENARNRMDGRVLLSGLADGAAAAVFFDPQYRGVLDKLGYGNEGARQKQRVELQQMELPVILDFLSQICRVLQPSGHLFLWVDKFHLYQGDVTRWLAEASPDLAVVDGVTWDKQRLGMGYRTRRKAEYLVVAQKTPTRARDVWLSHNIPDVWPEKVNGRAGSRLRGREPHGHGKPVNLQQALITAVTRPGDLVVDPAAGSYSVLEACRRAGGDRVFLGADLEDRGEWGDDENEPSTAGIPDILEGGQLQPIDWVEIDAAEEEIRQRHAKAGTSEPA